MFTRLPTAIFLVVALAACGMAASVNAQIYKVTDEKEGVVFTDQPKGLADESTVEEVELAPTNRAEPVTMPQEGQRKPSAAPAKPSEPTVTINTPDNESTIAMGPGNFTVSAAAEPPLGSGESLQLLMDGEPQGEPQRSTSWFLEGVLRGPHDLVVQRRAAGGNVIASSPSVRVYVLRPSIIGR